MIYPVQDISAPITSKFGNRVHPVTGVYKFHNGIDIAVKDGTPVYSPEAGTVTGTLDNEVGGKQLIVTHDNGIKTGYAHLSYRFVAKGQRVRQGQQIANSGNTGASTGAHLHFTMKDSAGNFLDPQNFYFTERTKRGNMAAILGGAAIILTLFYAIHQTTPKTGKIFS